MISQQFDPNLHIDVEQRHHEDINPDTESHDQVSVKIPNFIPNFKPIQISDGQVSIPNPYAGISGSVQSGQQAMQSFWDEQRRQAEMQAARDTERRREDDRKRLLGDSDREIAGLGSSMFPIGMGISSQNVTDDDIHMRQGFRPIEISNGKVRIPDRGLGTNARGFGTNVVDEAVAKSRDVVLPYKQVSVGVFDANDAEDDEYQRVEEERAKKVGYSEASQDARRHAEERSEAADNDELARRVRRVVRKDDENNSPDGKPLAFRTLAKDVMGGVKRGFRGLMSNRRSPSQKGRVSDEFAKKFKSRLEGNGFYAQMVQNPNQDLRLHQVGIGWQEVVALIEQAPEQFEALLRESGCVFDTIVPELGDPVDIEKIRRIVNYADGGVWVAVSKSPEVDIAHIHRMQLVILDDQERGLAFHPIIAPLHNADFDGDQAFVFFDKTVVDKANSTMDYIVSWEGRTDVNGDWVPSVGLASGTDVEKFVRENVFDEWNDGSNRIDGVVDAMSDILKNEDADPDQKMSMWVRLFRMAREMAGDNDVQMSKVIQTAYDFVRNQAVDDMLQKSGTPISVDEIARPKTDADRFLFDVVEYLIDAKMPNNWQAFRTLFRSFPGNIEGKNPAFRFTGDVGRSYVIDDRIRVDVDKRLLKEDGNYEVVTDDDWKTFHHMIAKYIAAKKMGLEKRKDERWQAARDAFRMRTIRRICSYRNPDMDLYAKDVNLSNGYPGKNGLDFDFIELFVRAYNVEVERANQAAAQFSDKYQHVEWGKQKPIKVDENGMPVDLSELAEPLLQVYPDMRMEYMFRALEWRNADRRWEGNPDHIKSGLHSYENDAGKDGGNRYWLLSRYDSMSILNFSRNNRAIYSKEKALEDISARYSDVKRGGSISRLQYGIMLAIADKKTSSASTFNKAFTGSYDSKSRRLHYYDATKARNRHAGARVGEHQKTSMDQFADAICELVYLDDEKYEDRAVEIEQIVYMVTELFPDMAHYFDMDTVEGWNESGYGRIFIEHARNAMRKDASNSERCALVDHLASTWMSMLFDYEMDDTYRKSSILENLGTDGTAEEMAESTNALAFSWNKLASKSEAWRGIVKEIQSGNEGWTALHEMALADNTSNLLHPEYWKTHESGSIIDVIHDTDMLYGEKVDIITDIVRWQLNDPWISTYEIPFGMRIGDNQLYSLSSASRKSALGDITNFADAYSSYAKTSRFRMHKEVRDARKRYGKSKGRLLKSIRALNSMPWKARKMSDASYSSVFVSILDKTTHQLEKGSQAAEPNFAYESMTMRHTDGSFSDLYQTDSRVLGIINIENVGISDFLKILSDPDETIVVCNRRGALSVVNASAVLFGELNHDMSNEEEVEERLWDFLEENPRLAGMLRLHEMCSSPDGGAWVGVSENGSFEHMIETMGNDISPYNAVDHAEYILEVHPGLASVITLCDPIGNRTSRSYPASTEKTKRYLLYRMCREARDVMSSRKDVVDAATEILEEFGVTRDSLVEANKSDYLKRLEANDMAVDSDVELGSEAAREAEEIYEIACGYVMKYITEIASEVDLSSIPSIEKYKAPEDIGDRRPNRESFSAFIDINQELGASKTARSTAVNGMTTFDHVEWVRFIDAQDKYVDLEWVMACAETDAGYPLGFDGAMTSVVDHDGKFVPFEASVNENGDVITNYETLRELAGNSEIVIAGNGARLKDRSTRKDGRVMPALFKQMDSKRSKGSEALNLKLKKFGLDVLDSIIKMGSKYRTDINYLQIIRAVNQIYEANDHDLMAVHLMLGYELHDAALEIGYKDLSLSDFTCIASLMTIVGEDGSVYVRSIEQLSRAIRYATSRLDHKPSVKEMRDLVNKIVNDNSTSSGIGIMTFDAVEAFDDYRPAKMASAILPTRHVSSNETRNHEMLDTIEGEQYDFTKPEFTKVDADKLKSEILYEKTAVGKTTKVGEPALSKVFFRCSTARDYTPIGGIGAKTKGKEAHSDIPTNAIGPRYAYIVGDGRVTLNEFQKAVDMCYRHGITMIVSNRHIDLVNTCKSMNGKSLDKGLSADALEASGKGDVIIPFFDMRLNGSEALPIQGSGAMFTVPTFDMYMASYEAKFKMLGDAVVKMFQHCANRMRLIDEGEQSISMDNLFPNVYLNPDYRRYNKNVREATSDEVANMIVNADSLPSIDIGISESYSNESRRHARAVAWAIDRYKDRWILLGGNVTDTVSTDLKPGDIVSWQICEISNPETGDVRYVFAPVIPFPLHGPTGVPPKYSITGISYDGLTGAGEGIMTVAWKNESAVGGNTVKGIDPMSGASKGVSYVPTEEFADPDDDKVVLETGTMMDLAMEEAATASRKEGTDKRLKTLVTLMVELRKTGYNFGQVDGAFPGRPDIAERVGIGSYREELVGEGDEQTKVNVGRITKREWRSLLADPNFKFSSDPKVNRLLRVESSKFLENGWNPSDFMANVLEYDDGTRNSGLMWEFETTLEPRLDYEDALLHFFHAVNPKFCPNGIDDMSEDHYFRMWRSDTDGSATGYDAGQVQMKVPVKDSSGNWYHLWHNVYVGRGFFAKQTTMLGRPNVTTAKFNPSAAHAMLYTHYGFSFDKKRESNLLDWALGGMRSNWTGSRRALAEDARFSTEDAEVVDDVSSEPVEMPRVIGADEVAATVEESDKSANDVPVKPFRNIGTSRPAGNYSSILDKGFEQYEKEQRHRQRISQVADQSEIEEARNAFVNSMSSIDVTDEDILAYQNLSTEDLADYLGITDEDIRDYMVESESPGDMEDYIGSHDFIDSDAVEDARQRYVRIAAYKRKYGGKVSSGESMYDIDFDNYDFSGKPVVSPIAMSVINGETSNQVRMSYIFEVEKKMAEDGGYLDEFLAYWTGGSVESQLESGIDSDEELSKYLSSIGARATVDDVLKTEADARKVRRTQYDQELAYRKGAFVKGLELPAYKYTIAYQRPISTLSNIRDELDNAIRNVDVDFTNVDGKDVNVGYGILLKLYELCDSKVKRAILEGPSAEMGALPKIRRRVRKGTIPTTSEARTNLVETVRQIESLITEIDELKSRANKVLQRDRIKDLTAETSRKLSEQAMERRLQAQQKNVEKVEGWKRIRNGSDPTNAVLGRISDAVAPRVERSQRRLHDFIVGDIGNERERELARIGMKFIETIENPTKILTSGFHGEARTEVRIRTKKDKKKTTVQITEARPSWGEENDVWLDRVQEYIGTGGGRLRAQRIAMCRMGLGIASDGTISHVSAEDFRISDRQEQEVLKDIIAYCERGMSPTDLSDLVRGDSRASRDSSGKFVVIGGTKRYPLFMPLSLWREICSDPTSKFYVEGENPSKVAEEHFRESIRSWRRDVHNAIVAEGDIEQLVSIDNLARAVLSMDGFDGSEASLPEIQTSLDIDALEADAVRSDDPDMYVPLEHMIQQMHESAEREARRQKHHIETDNRAKQVLKTTNRIRKTSGTIRISLLASSPFEEAENLVRANVANALVGIAQYDGEALTGTSPVSLHKSMFDYNDSEYKNVTTSSSFSENMQVVVALYRIGGEDLLDRYLDEKDEAGRAINTKLNKAELNSFLVRNGYIQGNGDTSQPGLKGAVEKAKNVTRATAAMAEKVMTDFATSEGLFSKQEARTFAKVYMSDARTLYADLDRRGELGASNSYAYAVDVNDAVAMAQAPGMGTGALVRKMMSTPTGREALATMGFFGAGRKNPITYGMQRLMWSSGVTEMLISTCINKYPAYGIGKKLNNTPLSSTLSYLATCGYSGIGDFLALAGESRRLEGSAVGRRLSGIGSAMGRASNYQMGTRSASLALDERTGRVKQRRLSLAGFRKNLIYDMVTAGSTLSKVLVTMQIINRFGLTPPEDPDNRLLYEEWKIGGKDGIPFKLAWWLDDLTGVSVPIAMGLLVNEGGSWDFTDEDGNVIATFDGGELAPSIIANGVASLNDGTFVFEAIDLFTHWDEHWRKQLGMDDFDKIGKAEEGELAPSSVEEWAIVTIRNTLFDQFGQMVPAIINEVVPTSRDYMFAGERLETSPYLLWNDRNGKITLEEAKRDNYVTGVDDWSELKLRQLTRNYWALGKIMDILNDPQTGYTWGEMPKKERIDKAAYAKWSQYSFDFSDAASKKDPDGWLTEQGEAVYTHILDNYNNADDAIADGFYLSYDALTNARAYCESKKKQLEIDKSEALDSISGIGGSYNEVKTKILQETDRQYKKIEKVSDILWSSDFPTSVPRYYQQTSDYVTRYVDSEGNPADIIDYWRGDATSEQYPYGNMPSPFTLISRPRQANKGWNNESLPWNFDGNEETEANKATAKQMYKDLVEGGLTYRHSDGTEENLGKTYFGGTDSPDGLMLNSGNLPTTDSRIDVAKRSSLPSFLRTKDDMEDYYKKATGIEFGDTSLSSRTTSQGNVSDSNISDESSAKPENEVTGNPGIDVLLNEYGVDGKDSNNNGSNYGNNSYMYRYGGGYSGYYRSSGSGGGSSYNPKIYSTSHQVYSQRASGMSTRQPYRASSGYLRPTFYTSGSRTSYLRMN